MPGKYQTRHNHLTKLTRKMICILTFKWLFLWKLLYALYEIYNIFDNYKNVFLKICFNFFHEIKFYKLSQSKYRRKKWGFSLFPFSFSRQCLLKQSIFSLILNINNYLFTFLHFRVNDPISSYIVMENPWKHEIYVFRGNNHLVCANNPLV